MKSLISTNPSSRRQPARRTRMAHTIRTLAASRALAPIGPFCQLAPSVSRSLSAHIPVMMLATAARSSCRKTSLTNSRRALPAAQPSVDTMVLLSCALSTYCLCRELLTRTMRAEAYSRSRGLAKHMQPPRSTLRTALWTLLCPRRRTFQLLCMNMS